MPLTRRRLLRLAGHDYATPGAYFVTVCEYRKQMLFADPPVAAAIQDAWHDIPKHFSRADVDEFVLMPNHIHGIVWITQSDVGAQHAAPLRANVAPGSLGAIVRSFKSAVTRHVNRIRKTPGAKLWQRNYYERVIRDENELQLVREYVRTNPLKWKLDYDNPERIRDTAHECDWGWLEGIAVA